MQTEFIFFLSIIFNYDTLEKPGSLCMGGNVYIFGEEKIQYFDSYGIKPITKELLSKICSFYQTLCLVSI